MPTLGEKLSGVFAPLTTPFRDDRLDEEALAYNI
jgi:dihydrodipicolinate synthase/N-acetylneuraminate lyase